MGLGREGKKDTGNSGVENCGVSSLPFKLSLVQKKKKSPVIEANIQKPTSPITEFKKQILDPTFGDLVQKDRVAGCAPALKAVLILSVRTSKPVCIPDSLPASTKTDTRMFPQ